MSVSRTVGIVLGLLLSVLVIPPAVDLGAQDASPAVGAFEVWVIDQSDTTPDGGGTLYIHRGPSLTEGVGDPEVIDLGDAVADRCFDQTASYPSRPHMILFNESHSHAILSFVASGHVVFFDAATREPVACIDAGEQAHAAFPSPDESYVVVANQNGKLLQRISTEYRTNEFVLDDAATVDLASCTTPSGAACEDPALRPDNAPICPIVDSTSVYTFVTLRGGGLLVFDSTATPMEIVAEYDAETIRPNGCGGLEAKGKMYLNSGGGSPANPFESDLYALPLDSFSPAPAAPNTPVPTVVFSHDDREETDSHGPTLAGDSEYLWVADRAANLITVVDTATDEVVNEIDVSGEWSHDPAPDLMDVSPDGQWVFISLRGSTPLTANSPEHHNAVGSTPGVAVVRVEDGGASGEVIRVLPISNMVDGAETADPHGLRVRRVE